MSVTVDFCECVHFPGFSANIFDVVDHAGCGRVKEQFHGDFFVLASDKLEYRRIEARDRDFGNLHPFVERVTLRVEETGSFSPVSRF